MVPSPLVKSHPLLQDRFPALKSRNYRLYFAGQGVSLIGSWMQHVAISWLCYRLTDSAFLLGLLGFLANLPLMLLTPLTGVLADRWNRHRMMIWVQVWEMGQALVLAVLTLGGWITIWQLVLLNTVLGVINAIDAPNRHAFVIQLVDDRRDLPNAIAMNSAIFNSARLIGPSVAGLVIAAIGEGLCFLLNAFSFLAVIISLRSMRMNPQKPVHSDQPLHILNEMKQGFLYTFGNRTMRLILIHFALVSMLGTSFSVLLPVMARDVLHGGASTMGFLTGGMGFGAMISALFLARRHQIKGLEKLVGHASILFGLGLIGLALSRHTALSLGIMVLVGMGMVAQMTTSNTYLHLTVEDDKRARVMGFYLLAYFASMPLGSLLTGALAEIIGAPATILLCGLACLISSAFYMKGLQRLAQSPAPAGA
jgi:MFS family permease